ncbi:toxin-antitoxin system HicB family antitoxin [Leucobacter viscericola]|uniref:Toxin-antitoxin system HicB family antitoxin n=1 Tax=Leucobacter viscericola TaxID=2714935 RepID=A0A6G7XB76_9MICO|nr:YlcI/YnfO family protein [Leucobacter viscericola]QIK61854.1 toxin-antitoxin system HicB family antitoxin [Leucobacter viscericola]
MELEQYVRNIQQQLETAAEAGGEEARIVAERLLAPLESSVRLALLEALSDAASEITLELSPGSVEVRLRGSDPEFVVSAAESTASENNERDDSEGDPEPTHAPEFAATEPDDGATSRTTLRLPDHLKTQVDEAAARQGISVNAWLVQAVAAAIHAPRVRQEHRSAQSRKSFKGWAQS